MDYSTFSAARGRVPNLNECGICHAFRPDGRPPTTHRSDCSEFVDQGVLRMVAPKPFDRSTGKVKR
jgi:hypothetical protein